MRKADQPAQPAGWLESSSEYRADTDEYGMDMDAWLNLLHFQVFGYFSDFLGDSLTDNDKIFERAQRLKLYGTEDVPEQTIRALYYHLLITRKWTAEQNLWRFQVRKAREYEIVPPSL